MTTKNWNPNDPDIAQQEHVIRIPAGRTEGGILWKPQPRQLAFQARREYEALYGGAAGGGKSDALLCEALRQIAIPHYRALILRKTRPELSELIDRSRVLYGALSPQAVYRASAQCWEFPSGAKIFFGSMHRPQDRFRYQGLRYDYIAFDELTHFTYEEYAYLFSRNRPSGPGTRVYIRAATNPGGVGHAWVKSRFITPAPPLTPICETVTVNGPDGPRRFTRSRVFVPSTVFDNEILLRQDPQYLASLSMLPGAERDALLYGSWDSFSGQVFREWRNDPAHYADRRWTHVIDPFRIPPHWRIWRGFDFGYAKPFAVGWFAADPDGRIYHIREYYGCTGTPNTGVKCNPAQIAEQIREIEETDPNLRGRKILGIADPSIFDESRGESVAAMMARSPHFITFRPADNTRIAGKMQMHYRLAFDSEGFPMFQVFAACRNFIRTVPALTYSASNVEDVDTDGEDHIYDMARYVLMERPMSPAAPQKQALLPDDPLDLRVRPAMRGRSIRISC